MAFFKKTKKTSPSEPKKIPPQAKNKERILTAEGWKRKYLPKESSKSSKKKG